MVSEDPRLAPERELAEPQLASSVRSKTRVPQALRVAKKDEPKKASEVVGVAPVGGLVEIRVPVSLRVQKEEAAQAGASAGLG